MKTKILNQVFKKIFLTNLSMCLLILLFGCNREAQTTSCLQPPAGMVSWWPGDGHTQDIQGGNDGTLENGTIYSNGKVGQAFSFDGVDDFVLVPDNYNLDIVGDVTVDLWAKRTGFGGTATLISKGAGFTPVDEPTVFLLRFVDNRLQAVFEPTATNLNQVLDGPVVKDSDFHFYAYVRSGNTHTLYMDGNLVASGTFNLAPASTIGLPLTIGAQNHDPFGTSAVPGYLNLFKGLIDEIEVFDRALSTTEIQDIYHAGSNGKCKNQSPRPLR